MSSPPADQWGMPDAWLLAAISTARPDPDGAGATLAEVLSAADDQQPPGLPNLRRVRNAGRTALARSLIQPGHDLRLGYQAIERSHGRLASNEVRSPTARSDQAACALIGAGSSRPPLAMSWVSSKQTSSWSRV